MQLAPRRIAAVCLIVTPIACAEPDPQRDWERSLEQRADEAGTPAVAVIDKLERRLEKEPCIGELSNWQRRYWYGYDEEGPFPAPVDKGKVEFKLSEAGKFDFVSGRRIVRLDDADAQPMIDDRPYLVVFGRYDTTKEMLTLDGCGPNI